MTDDTTKTRAAWLERFATHAEAVFAQQPQRRSMLLVIAQYWNDNANDEVHARCVVSERDQPVWPHECGDVDDDYNTEPAFATEACGYCGAGDEVDLEFYGSWDDETVQAFAPLCREGSNQSQDLSEAYVPYAVARRCDDGVAIEIVGGYQREPLRVLGDAAVDEPWDRALFEQVCAAPRDDGPRAVLADELLVRRPDDSRAEAIVRALGGDIAGHDALVAEHLAQWIAPLGAVIPPGGAHVERGFLARADVYAADEAACERVRGARAWGTVEQLRYLPGSRDVLDPAMRALRDVGPVGSVGIDVLVRAPRTWAIERLRLAPHTSTEVEAVLRARTLPRLRELVLDAEWLSSVFGVRARPMLQRVVALTSAALPPAVWRDHRESLAPLPWLAVARPDDIGQPAGWQLAFGPEDRVVVEMVGWHQLGTLHGLAELLRELPASARPVELASSRYFAFTAQDVAYVAEHAGRAVRAISG
jgi:hypothetical protein